jgi:hypothetical protein
METSASNLRVFLNPGVFGKDNPGTNEELAVVVAPRGQDAESSTLEESEIIHRKSGSSSPRSLLSAARSDPFSPWNIALKWYGLEVLDYCKSLAHSGRYMRHKEIDCPSYFLD